MKILLRTLALGAAFFTASVCLSGCNTIRGIGQDVQRVGSAVEGVGKKQ